MSAELKVTSSPAAESRPTRLPLRTAPPGCGAPAPAVHADVSAPGSPSSTAGGEGDVDSHPSRPTFRNPPAGAAPPSPTAERLAEADQKASTGTSPPPALGAGSSRPLSKARE